MAGDEQRLRRVLERGREIGLLGPGPVDDHIDHARAFLQALGDSSAPVHALDLGSGAGLPGLPLTLAMAASRWVLLDAHQRRTTFLRSAVRALGVEDRVTVALGRAEQLAHDPNLRARFDVVVARSFGPPAVTAECAAGFLRPGGRLVVSEPPEPTPERWPADGLRVLGMRAGPPEPAAASAARCRVITQVVPCPDRYPRRIGVPGKRPLF